MNASCGGTKRDALVKEKAGSTKRCARVMCPPGRGKWETISPREIMVAKVCGEDSVSSHRELQRRARIAYDRSLCKEDGTEPRSVRNIFLRRHSHSPSPCIRAGVQGDLRVAGLGRPLISTSAVGHTCALTIGSSEEESGSNNTSGDGGRVSTKNLNPRAWGPQTHPILIIWICLLLSLWGRVGQLWSSARGSSRTHSRLSWGCPSMLRFGW